MGAGDAGAMIVRELKNNPHLGLEPVGFLDDDLGKHDVRIHGIPVLGDRQAIPEMVAAHKVKLVIIAMPTASGKTIREIIAICGKAGVETRIVPGLYELLGGAVSVQQLREVQIEDLLRRAPVQIDAAQVATLVRGKRVLVTGAGGSIGSELCRQIARLEPAELVLLGHGENSIFDIHNELRNVQTFKRSNVQTLWPVIADIRDADRLHAVLGQYRPEVIFHAAAHKHVPLMESNEVEAVTNNVLGTRNLVRAAMQAGVTHFVLISTDKAVNPSSVMGTTKRIAELIVQQAARQSGQAFVAVRFGNVLGSRGSVIPYFRKQIAAGGPVTVTHPEMRRYFMTIPEAVQLVIAGGGHRTRRRGVRAGYGRAGVHQRSGVRSDPPLRTGTRPGHRRGIHWIAAGRKAVRGALFGSRGAHPHATSEGLCLAERPGARGGSGKLPGCRRG